jgi:sigma-B regulation protein RsbU (phosphoserine phosphatase)
MRDTTNNEYLKIYRDIYENGLERGTVVRKDGLNGKEAHITSLIPIKNSRGKVSAVLCVERPMEELFLGRMAYLKNVLIATSFLLIALCVCLAFYIKRNFAKPIEKISEEATRFAKEPSRSDKTAIENISMIREIKNLAESIDKMEYDTLHNMEELTRVTAEQERMAVELSLAATIQANMLPSKFPPYPNRLDFDIYASMTPAKEVGGDFYDFFLVDDDHIALVMADVAGKGIPAALFMMISKILIRNRVQNGERPGEALRNVNNQLMEGNEAELFVTVWLAIVEISTGKGVEVNAGHEHPVLRRSDGEFELIKYRHSLAVAAMEDVPFREREFMLYPGDTVFVYTDGVAEAANEKNELYGTERMLSILNQKPDAEPEEVLRHVMQGINTFVDGAEQFDDITMLCFKYIGPVQEDGATDIVDRDADASAADDNEKNSQESKEREGTDQESETRESKDRESEDREGTAQDSESV